MSEQVKSKLQEIFSADERKLSALVISLLAWVLVGVYKYMTIGEITSNYVAVAGLLISAVAGINIFKKEPVVIAGNNGNNTMQIIDPLIPEPIPIQQNKLY